VSLVADSEAAGMKLICVRMEKLHLLCETLICRFWGVQLAAQVLLVEQKPAISSYTGEKSLEHEAHGGKVLINRLIDIHIEYVYNPPTLCTSKESKDHQTCKLARGPMQQEN
jgi:hypothetical protein